MDGDGTVNCDDLAVFLASWGATGPNLPADVNQNAAADLVVLLGSWGDC
jgi:hypothetical protein